MRNQFARIRPLPILILGCSLFVYACDSSNKSTSHGPWPSADSLFRSNPTFLGGDSAYSADLGDGRVLWQFGDTFVGPGAGGTRADSVLVRNAMAIQTGYNPESANLNFFSAENNGAPTAIFTRPEPNWLWPGPAVMVGSQLLLTYFELKPTDSGLGFEAVDGAAFLVSNPESPPDVWQTLELDIPVMPEGVRFGTGALLLQDNFLFAYTAVEPGSHDVYLVRWDAAQVEAGNLLAPEFYNTESGWHSEASLAHPVAEQVQTEFSVHHDSTTDQFIMISVDGFGGTNIVKRSADKPEGPWSDANIISRPSESDRGAGTLVYSAKAHPFLLGGDMVITYSTNHLDFDTLLTDMSIYYPRFQREL